MKARDIPEATVSRLPIYLRALLDVSQQRRSTISSDGLAELSGVNAAQVRKDLSYMGNFGTRGVGYEVDPLVRLVSRELGLTRDWPVAIVGAGNLGQALANYKGFGEKGFSVAAILDTDRAKVGRNVGGVVVSNLDDLPKIVAERSIAIAIIATPAAGAQGVVDRLVASGVRSILNFAPSVLSVPPGVSLRHVDLSMELQILSFYEHRMREGAAEKFPS